MVTPIIFHTVPTSLIDRPIRPRIQTKKLCLLFYAEPPSALRNRKLPTSKCVTKLKLPTLKADELVILTFQFEGRYCFIGLFSWVVKYRRSECFLFVLRNFDRPA